MTIYNRLMSKVNKKTNGCWEYTGATSCGYGWMHYKNGSQRTHRIMWELVNGPIPEHEDYHGLCVCHTCDNRVCVNPKHLFLARQKENMRDMYKKGKDVRNIGEQNGQSKLKEGQVRAIKANSENLSQRQLARIFSVSQCTIYNICNNITWRHIQ